MRVLIDIPEDDFDKYKSLKNVTVLGTENDMKLDGCFSIQDILDSSFLDVLAKEFPLTYAAIDRTEYGDRIFAKRVFDQFKDNVSYNISSDLLFYAIRNEAFKQEQEEKIHLKDKGRFFDSIRDWYMKKYPDDEIGSELSDISFMEVIKSFPKNKFYDIIGECDSVIRQRVFSEIAFRADVSYALVYDAWLDKTPLKIPKQKSIAR